ncbi:MAG: hypothetical protein SFV18_08935 [Bryobacteraceae bacterium]|jgi:hypothetical protein|nr:hypothetical protein [Bryobacteraceae bacterium]
MENIPGQRLWDRTASADLWLRTLAQIPALFGRLAYLSSLRDANTDRYQHHGLETVFGQEEANRALRESHERTFQTWLGYSLEQQKADLDLYLSALDTPKRVLLQTWQRLAPYKNFIPSGAPEHERSLYLIDLEILLELLRSEHAAAGPLRGASQRR